MASTELSNEKKSIGQPQAHVFRIFGDVIQGFLGNIPDTMALTRAGLIKSRQIIRIVCEIKDKDKMMTLPNLTALRMECVVSFPYICFLEKFKTNKLTELEIIWPCNDENKYNQPLRYTDFHALRRWKLTKLRLDGHSFDLCVSSQPLADMNLKELSLPSCSGMSLAPLRHIQFDKLIVPGYSMKEVVDVFGDRLPGVLVTGEFLTFGRRTIMKSCIIDGVMVSMTL